MVIETVVDSNIYFELIYNFLKISSEFHLTTPSRLSDDASRDVFLVFDYVETRSGCSAYLFGNNF